MRTAVRTSAWAGLAAPGIALGAILLGTLLSPTFGWSTHALSNLGGPGDPAATPTTRLLFNGGLVAASVVGLGFGPALVRSARNRIELAGTIGFGLTVLAMGLIGVFPQHRSEHLAVAVSFYLLATVSLIVYGVGNLAAGARGRAALTVGGGLATAGAWIGWAATGPPFRPGLALPEIVGAAVLSAWAVATSVDVRRRLDG